MARSEKNVTVTRRVSEAEQREKPYIDTGPRLRVGLLCVDADGTCFSERAIFRRLRLFRIFANRCEPSRGCQELK